MSATLSDLKMFLPCFRHLRYSCLSRLSLHDYHTPRLQSLSVSNFDLHFTKVLP